MTLFECLVVVLLLALLCTFARAATRAIDTLLAIFNTLDRIAKALERR